MAKWWGWLFVLAATACSGEATIESPDAGFMSADAMIAPRSPDEGALADPGFAAVAAPARSVTATVVAPNPGTCPTGWILQPLAEGHRCVAPAERTDCVDNEVSDPTGACRRVGAPCAADGWPVDLPSESAVVFVDPDAAPGGTGTQQAPLQLISAALDQAPPGAIIALRAADHQGPFTIDTAVTLWGACNSLTRLVAEPEDQQALLQIVSSATIRELTVAGQRPGIRVGGGPSEIEVALVAVSVDGAIHEGLSVEGNARVTGDDVWIRNVAPPLDGVGGYLLAARGGGAIELRNGVLENGAGVGVLAQSAADVTLQDTVVRGVVVDQQGVGIGAQAMSTARLVLRGVVIEDVFEVAVIVTSAGALDASHFAVRNIAALPSGPRLQLAVLADEQAQVEIFGGAFESMSPLAVVAFDPGTRLVLSDIWVGDVDRDIPNDTFTAASGSTLIAERIWIEDESGIGAVGEGSTAIARDMTVRAPASSPLGGWAVVVDRAATATVTGLDVSGTAGGGVFAPGSRLQISSARIRANAAGLTSLFILEGALELRSVLIDDEPGDAIFAATDSVLIAQDVTIRRSGRGVTTLEPSDVQLSRVRIADSVESGMFLFGGEATLEDVMVDGLTGRIPGEVAIAISGGATVAVSRLSLTNLVGDGLWVLFGSRVTAQDVRIDSMEAIERVEHGVFVGANAFLQVERLSVRDYIVGAQFDAPAIAHDVAISGFASGSSNMAIGGKGDIQLLRARITDRTGFGVLSYGEGTFQVEDLVIDNVEPFADFSVGVAAIENSELTGRRLKLTKMRTAGVLAGGSGRAIVRDLTILDPREPDCSETVCGIAGAASGVYVQDDGLVDLEQFELSGFATAGLVVNGGGIDARLGIVSDSGFGLLVVEGEYDPERASEGVLYRGNQRDVLSRPSLFPPIRFEPPPAPVVEEASGG